MEGSKSALYDQKYLFLFKFFIRCCVFFTSFQARLPVIDTTDVHKVSLTKLSEIYM